MNPKLVLSVLSVILVLFVGAVYLTRPQPSQFAQLDQFAQCLADKGVTMYGAAWCSHCQNQKKLFGSSFQYVPYVECPNVPQLCVNKGVSGYPTWIMGNTKLEGEQPLSKLSELSSCPLP